MTKLIYPFLNAKKVKPKALDQYYEEPKTLGEVGINTILDSGKKWGRQLANTLNSGGAVLFPHTFLRQCGYQIAAAVHAILDSGADQVLLLGVLHPISEALKQARSKELNDDDISNEPTWGVLGPGLDRNDCWKMEFSLDLFKILLKAEVNRRGIIAPKLIERYPSLVNKEPDKLPGIGELQKISKDSAVVATDDMCHHGIGYGVSEKDAIGINEKGYQFARKSIEEGYELLKHNQYRDYFFHWMNPSSIGDPTDTAVVLKYLLGDVSMHIVDLTIVDVSSFFENDVSPSWVAGTLVEFKK